MVNTIEIRMPSRATTVDIIDAGNMLGSGLWLVARSSEVLGERVLREEFQIPKKMFKVCKINTDSKADEADSRRSR